MIFGTSHISSYSRFTLKESVVQAQFELIDCSVEKNCALIKEISERQQRIRNATADTSACEYALG